MLSVLEFYDCDPRRDHGETMARCPLHEDRTPSMSVNIDKGVYLCHSCGSKGNALTMIEQVEGVTRSEARDFAAAHGLTIGGTESSDDTVSGFADLLGFGGGGSSQKVSRGSGRGRGHGGWVPPWRR